MTKTFYKLVLGASLSLGICATTSAAQTVVDFEDFYSGNSQGSYKGVTGWGSMGSTSTSGDGTGSGDYYFHGFGGTLTFDNAPVVFDGMLYNIWAGSGIVPTYDLYYKDQRVFAGSVDAATQPFGLYWLASGYSGRVDRIDFYGTSDGFAVDNFTYSAAPVPEPESWLMLLAGLGALAGYSRRRS